VIPGLRGDNLPLDARQHQLRFGQGQTQIGDVDEAIGPARAVTDQVDTSREGFSGPC
jgi:hypothetical protein